MEVIITVTKNEVRSEGLIDYYIVEDGKHFDRNYHYYCEIDKKKTAGCTIDDRIVVVHKIVAKSF